MTEPKAVSEIHAIREKISRETANLTPKEKAERVNENAQKAIEQHGIKLKAISL